MFGRKQRIIAEQEEQIRTLEQQIESLTADNRRLKDRVIDVERRERGIGRALNEATATADNMITDAQRKAAVLLEQTQTECETLRKQAEDTVDDAYRSAREIIREAEDENEKKRAELQQRIDQYSALLAHYDAADAAAKNNPSFTPVEASCAIVMVIVAIIAVVLAATGKIKL